MGAFLWSFAQSNLTLGGKDRKCVTPIDGGKKNGTPILFYVMFDF